MQSYARNISVNRQPAKYANTVKLPTYTTREPQVALSAAVISIMLTHGWQYVEPAMRRSK